MYFVLHVDRRWLMGMNTCMSATLAPLSMCSSATVTLSLGNVPSAVSFCDVFALLSADRPHAEPQCSWASVGSILSISARHSTHPYLWKVNDCISVSNSDSQCPLFWNWSSTNRNVCDAHLHSRHSESILSNWRKINDAEAQQLGRWRIWRIGVGLMCDVSCMRCKQSKAPILYYAIHSLNREVL